MHPFHEANNTGKSAKADQISIKVWKNDCIHGLLSTDRKSNLFPLGKFLITKHFIVHKA